MLVIIGFVIVIVGVLGGYMMAGGALGVLNQPPEFFVIGGAAVGSLLVSTPGRVLSVTVAQIKAALSGSGPARQDYVDLMFQLFKVVRQSGAMALESHFEEGITAARGRSPTPISSRR
jgi:chemotaxis protein MotA